MGRVISDPTNANVQGYAAFMSRLTPGASKQINTIASQVMALPTKEQRVEALKAAYTAHMGQEATNRVFGAPTMVDDGQTIQSGTQGSPMDGAAFSPASGVQKQVSPESDAALVPVWTRDPNNPDGGMVQTMTTAGSLRGGGGSGFTGRQRIDTAGGSYGSGNASSNGGDGGLPASGPASARGAPSGPVSQMPLASLPVGYEENVKTGQQVRNSLAAQQNDVTQNIATLRNMDALLGSVPKDARSRALKDIANNLNKFGLGGQDANRYATIAQEIDKAGTALRQQMMEGGGVPHTNAGLDDLGHVTPSMEMTPAAARALTNETLTRALHQQGRQKIAASQSDPTKVMSALADYDQAFDPRFATIQRLGPDEGREYARTHIPDQAQYAASVRRMAQAQRDQGYDYGLTPTQINRILGTQNGR
ncbi:hypothetical protein D3W54_14795 [Komagataeibacter medellinensis]|uniref:Uncharacterized protein n=2 Tax=Komagataeibacter medellinensis TaxID=1177712 RepID=A0ABQ6VR81_9PROT|nr:hypothetical protein D3W54_14795 [Komagataeibacter medellinensis]